MGGFAELAWALTSLLVPVCCLGGLILSTCVIRVSKPLPEDPQIRTCDTCMVEVNGQLVRACATSVSAGMKVETKTARADAAQREAFDRILGILVEL